MIKLLSPRVLVLFLLPNVLFATVALLLPPARFIWVCNAGIMAGSIGVCVAYHKPVLDILLDEDPMESSDWLALGIFLSWFGTIVARIWSITWRSLGKPDWLEDTHVISYSLWMVLCAAVFHLAAPGAIGNKRVPNERWIKIGIWLAAAVFAFMVAGYLLDWLGAGPRSDGQPVFTSGFG